MGLAPRNRRENRPLDRFMVQWNREATLERSLSGRVHPQQDAVYIQIGNRTGNTPPLGRYPGRDEAIGDGFWRVPEQK